MSNLLVLTASKNLQSVFIQDKPVEQMFEFWNFFESRLNNDQKKVNVFFILFYKGGYMIGFQEIAIL